MTTTIRYSNLPHIRGAPVLGALPAFLHAPLKLLSEAQEKYGDIVRINMAGQPFVLITHPEDIEYVLVRNQRNYVKGYDQARAIVGNGLILNEGSSWLRQRRLIQPAFHREKIDSLVDIIVSEIHRLISDLEDNADREEKTDLYPTVARFTRRVIAKTMFGDDSTAGQRIGEAFTVTLAGMEVRLAAPPWFTRLRWISNRRFNEAKRIIDEETGKLIAARRGNTRHDDLLTMLLEARDADTGEGMTDRELRDEITTVYLAGYETTALALVWTLHLLAYHPHYLGKICNEACSVFGSRSPTAADVEGLIHARAALDESLRLYPPGWQFTRRALNPDIVGGAEIPAGTNLWLSPYVTHHRPDLWDEPYQFRPERFTDSASGSQRPSYAYFPFGGGPRKCIGYNLATTEATLALSMLARRFGSIIPEEVNRRVQPKPRTTLNLDRSLKIGFYG